MSSKRRRYAAVVAGLVAFTIAGCGTPSDDMPLSSPLRLDVPIERLSRDLQRFIPEQLNQSGVPGLSIAIVRDGQVVWSEGFGVANLVTLEPVRSDTVFEVASISKPITAYAALRLVEQGKLALDVPFHHYLARPFLPESSRREAISLRRVLTHTSGLSNLLMGTYADTRIWFPPGDHFSYSGHGFQYLGAAIEAVTGMPLDRHIQTTVLHELRMDSSGYRLEKDLQLRHANPHVSMATLATVFTALWLLVFCAIAGARWLAGRLRKSSMDWAGRAVRRLLAASAAAAAIAFAGVAHLAGFSSSVLLLLPIGLFLLVLLFILQLSVPLVRDIRQHRARMFHARSYVRAVGLLGAFLLLALIVSLPAVPLPVRRRLDLTAAGGLRSTAPDLARFMIELMDPQKIDPALIQQMLQPQVRVSEHVSWGLGIGLQHSPLGDSFWHWGSNPGYESLMIGSPAQKIGVVILTNGGPAGRGLAVARRVAHRAIGGEHHSYWQEIPGVFWPSGVG